VTPNPARRPLLASAAVLALAVPVLGVATPASADHLACGDVIVVDTRLTHDLVCGPGDGLVIGADGIVLDLGGYSITGQGTGAGVRIPGYDGVTITKGEISDFATAVEVQQSTGSTVSKLDLHKNGRGVNVGTGGGHLIEKNTITGSSLDAIRVDGSVSNLIAKNVLDGNVFGIGIANNSVGNVAEKNVITASRDWGIAAFAGPTATVIEKNVVTGTTHDGIILTAATSLSVLTKNETSGNGASGIVVDTASATLTKNLAVGNGDLGIEAVLGVTDGGGNRAAGNGNPLQCTGVTCLAP
jgi:Right handed beta helix region